MLPKRCNRGTVSYVKGERVPKDWGIVTIIIIIIMYLYSAQYLHILQDSKRYLTNPTVQVQPQLTSNSHSPNWKIEAQG